MLKAGNPAAPFAADTLGYAIEQAMIEHQVFDPADDTDEIAQQRRRAVAAIAQGVVEHLSAALELTIAQNRIATGLPATAVQLRGQDGAVR